MGAVRKNAQNENREQDRLMAGFMLYKLTDHR
jgi:hypothetical protein